MMLTWYDEYLEQLTYHMSHPRLQTGRLPIYGGTADKVTDDSGKQYEVINTTPASKKSATPYW